MSVLLAAPAAAATLFTLTLDDVHGMPPPELPRGGGPAQVTRRAVRLCLVQVRNHAHPDPTLDDLSFLGNVLTVPAEHRGGSWQLAAADRALVLRAPAAPEDGSVSLLVELTAAVAATGRAAPEVCVCGWALAPLANAMAATGRDPPPLELALLGGSLIAPGSLRLPGKTTAEAQAAPPKLRLAIGPAAGAGPLPPHMLVPATALPLLAAARALATSAPRDFGQARVALAAFGALADAPDTLAYMRQAWDARPHARSGAEDPAALALRVLSAAALLARADPLTLPPFESAAPHLASEREIAISRFAARAKADPLTLLSEDDPDFAFAPVRTADLLR